jgi:putative acetyltransferase
MTLAITLEDPCSADGRALIAGSDAALLDVFLPDEIFTMEPEELARPEARFFVARDAAGTALGCVALVDCGGYGEVKRLFVPTEGRGKGVARALMAALEAHAKAAGLPIMRLETGPVLTAAIRLYESLGYRVRGPFGDYADHPASLFMEKVL